MPKRFNFDMRKVELSSMILTNQITREDALEILKEPPLSEVEIKNEFKFISNKLDITEDELKSFLEIPKKFFWDYSNNYKVLSLGEKILQLFGSSRRGGAF